MFVLVALVLVISSDALSDPSSSGAGELNEGVDPWPELGEPLVPGDFGERGPLVPEDEDDTRDDGEDDRNAEAEESTKSIEEDEEVSKPEEAEEKNEEKHSEEEEEEEEKVAEKKKPFVSVFDTPLFDVDRLTRYFKQLEGAVDKVFSGDLSKNGTGYSDMTEEEVDSDGNKLLVHKSVLKTEDGGTNSSVVVETVSGRTKRSNSESMRIQ